MQGGGKARSQFLKLFGWIRAVAGRWAMKQEDLASRSDPSRLFPDEYWHYQP